MQSFVMLTVILVSTEMVRVMISLTMVSVIILSANGLNVVAPIEQFQKPKTEKDLISKLFEN
jgi:hypothetical protein